MGGGGVDIPQRNLSQELPQIFGAFKKQELPLFNNQWFNKQPLLAESRTAALAGLSDLPMLQQQIKDYQAQLQGYGTQLGGLLPQFGDISNQVRGYQGDLGALLPTIQGYEGNLGDLLPQLQGFSGEIGGYKKPIQGIVDYLNPILQSGGALTPEGERTATQEAAARNAAAGMATTTPGLFSEALNREQYRQQRYNQAYQQATGATGLLGQLTGEQAGITGQEAGIIGQQGQLAGLRGNIIGQQGQLSNLLSNILGQQAGVIGQQAGITGMGAGLTGEYQGLTAGAINPALQTEQTATGTFAQLLNPLLSYGSDLFSSNQNAAAAQSVAGANKSSGTLSGILGLVGSIAAAY